jgi:hypothetical protein
MRSAEVCSTESVSAKPDGLEFPGSQKILIETMATNSDDWRTPLVHYLENSDHIADKKVQRQALKYVMLDNTLYHQTIGGFLLR